MANKTAKLEGYSKLIIETLKSQPECLWPKSDLIKTVGGKNWKQLGKYISAKIKILVNAGQIWEIENHYCIAGEEDDSPAITDNQTSLF